jgi:hypothetical protein
MVFPLCGQACSPRLLAILVDDRSLHQNGQCRTKTTHRFSPGPGSIERDSPNAAYVDRILRDEKTAGLPVQHPTKFKFAVNFRTARTLGVEIPQSMLNTADEVIE